MASQFGCFQKHSNEVCCPKCGQQGSIIWDAVQRPDGEIPDHVTIDGDFHERIAKKPPYPIELVCNSCGTTQPSVLQS
jgi:hypothetical protein